MVSLSINHGRSCLTVCHVGYLLGGEVPGLQAMADVMTLVAAEAGLHQTVVAAQRVHRRLVGHQHRPADIIEHDMA